MEQRKPWNRAKRLLVLAAWIVVGGGLVGSVFVLSFIMAMQSDMRATEVDVPDLTGLTLEDAADRVAPMALVLEVVEQRHDPRMSSGRVLDQMPPADVSVRRGRKVKLVLSLGGEVLRVPDLVGHAARAVSIELDQEGFAAGDEVHLYSHDVPAGRVMAQVPLPDTTALPNSRVHRLVSDGSPATTWVMPDLAGLSRDAAERWIREAGFRRGPVHKRGRPDRVSGQVIGQSPRAGYPIRSNDVVELTVAR